MANAFTTQTLLDNERNFVIKLVGILDTGNASLTDLVDPAALDPACTRMSVSKALFSVQSPLSLNLYWDATTDVPVFTFTDSHEFCFTEFSGLPNNAGAGITGKLQYDTTGYSAGIVTFSLILCMKKMR